MTTPPADLPPIETWWPQLTIDARHALLEDPEAPLPAEVRADIARITGHEVAPDTRLDDHELGFVETQQEPVD